MTEQFAAASMRRWEGGGQVSLTQSAIVLATIHVRAGEPRGLQLAHGAITSAGKLTSVRARRRLEPLAAALEPDAAATPSSSPEWPDRWPSRACELTRCSRNGWW